MRRLLFFGWIFLITTCCADAAGALAIVNASIQQTEDGAPLPPGFTYVPGEILFFSFQVEGYQVSPKEKIHLSCTVEATDPRKVPIMEPIESEVDAELAPQDKNWKPKIRHDIPIPPLADSGVYKIAMLVKDDLAKTSATKEIAFEVRGREVAPSDTPVIRNFHFFRKEEDQEPLAKAAYRPGDTVWARLDITGYKFAEHNRIDVSYGISVLAPSGKVLWSQPEAGAEREDSFYPKRYVPGVVSLSLQPNIRPGEYTIVITVRDAIGGQSYETKQKFSVE